MENKTINIGGTEFTFNPKGLLETLNTIDKVPVPAQIAIASVLGCYVAPDPFDKKLFKPVLMGHLQLEWYKAFGQDAPPNCSTFQANRVARFKQQTEELKNNDGQDVVTGGKAKKVSTVTKAVNLFRLREDAKPFWSKFKGQKYLIIKAMLDAGAVGPDGKGISVRQIADTVKDTPETTAPSDKNCHFHMTAFGHEYMIERADGDKWVKPFDDSALPEAEKPKAAAPKPEPKAAEPKKAEPKKPAASAKKK